MLTLKEVRAQYPGAQDLSDDELIDVLANRYGADKFTVMEAIGYKPEAGVFRTAGDMAVKGAQGVVDLGQSVVGLASLATGGKAGEAMRSIGYDPERTNKTLGEFLSTAQQVSENKVQSADGFVNTVATALQNPRAIAGSVAESMPGMFAAGAGSSFMARSIAAKAAAPFGGLTTAKGAAAAKAAVDAAANRLMWAGAAGEGAQTAGQIADQAQGAGRQFTDYAGPALAAGVGTAVIGRAAGKLMGDAETALFTGSAGAGIKGGMAARVGKGIIGEGLLEEMPQSALEQMFTNLAMGKPAMEGVGNAAGMGLVTGAAMGAGMGAIQKDNAPIAERPPAPKRDPIAEIGSAPNLDAAAAAATAAVDEVLNEPAATPPAGPSAFTPPASLTNTAIDFTGGEANNAFMAAARERLAQQTLTGQMPADLMGGLAPENTALLQAAQGKQEDRRQTALEDRAMADMERQAARDFAAQRDLQDMPRSTSTGIIDGDIMNSRTGEPFKTAAGAKVASAKTPGEVVKVTGGFVVRPSRSLNVSQPASIPPVATGADRGGNDQPNTGMDAGVGLPGEPGQAVPATPDAGAGSGKPVSPGQPADAVAVTPAASGWYTVSDGISADGPVAESVRLTVRPDGTAAFQRDNSDVIDITNMLRAGFSPERAIAQAIGHDTTGVNVTRTGKPSIETAVAVAPEIQPVDVSNDGKPDPEQVAPNREAKPEPFKHVGLNIYPIKTKDRETGEPVSQWAVQTPDNAEREARGERQIGGDSIVSTRDEAIKTAEQESTRAKANAESRAAIDAKAKADDDAAKARAAEDADIDGFRDDRPPVVRGRVVKVLSQTIRNNGKETTRKAVIRDRVSRGATVQTVGDERRLTMPDGAYLTESQITKIGMEYAEHLIAKALPQPQSAANQPKKGATDEKIQRQEAAQEVLTAQPAQGEGQAPPSKSTTDRVDGNSRNSPPQHELDGYKVGDRVTVEGRTAGPSTIETLFTRDLPGFSDPSMIARLRTDKGGVLDVLTTELRKIGGGNEPTSQFSDLERELQAKTHKDEQDGDVGVVVGGGKVEYASLADAIEVARKAIAAGTKAVPFQIHSATGIRLGDVDRVLAEANKQPSDSTVKIPPTVDAALTEDMERQKRRVARLKREAEAPGLAMAEKASALTKVKAAETTLRKMRTTRFDAEDAAVKAVAESNADEFSQHADLFWSASNAINALITDAKPKADKAEIRPYRRSDGSIGYEAVPIVSAGQSAPELEASKSEAIDKALSAVAVEVKNRQGRDGKWQPIDMLKFNTAVAAAKAAGVKVSTQPPGSSGTVVWSFEKPNGDAYTAYLEKSGKGTWMSVKPATSPAPKQENPDPRPTDTKVQPGDSEEIRKAKADLMAGLGDLASLLTKNTRMNIVPEQEQQLLPILTRIMDASLRLGYHSFKDAAKFTLDKIREMLGGEIANAITLDHLQGAYIGMAGRHKDVPGVSSKREVIEVEDKADVEAHTIGAGTNQQPDGQKVENAPAGDDTGGKEPRNGTTQPSMGAQDQAGGQGARSGRGSGAQQPDAQVDPGDLGEMQPGDVGAAASGEPGGSAGASAAGQDVGSQSGTDAGRSAGDGRTRGSRARNPDARTGGRSGKRPARSPAAPGTDDLFAGPVDSPRPEEPVAPETVSPANTGPGDFVIADPLKVVGGGQVARFEKNKAAIELRNTLIEAGRAPTREEQEVLAGYTGWGSFGQELFQGNWAKPAPKQGWEARDRWLRDNLGQSEWEGLQTSIINAHYTDPPTVMAMWEMVRRLGFTGGRTLEPSIGIGNFYGLMPVDMASRSQRAGIELDEVTGSMAQMLYPNANIQIKGYEESTTPDNFYDVVIGNWPFSEIKPADRRYNRLGPNLHDYFFLKALDQTRPGGLVVGITTKGTMDKKAVNVRMEMARKAELVAAFRLPSGAFEEYAGTKVVTDIIILRKRDKPQQIVDREGWIEVLDHPTKEGTAVPVNEYFHRNPTHVIGEIDFGHGTTTMRPGLIVHRPADMLEQLRRIVAMVPESQWQANATAKAISYVANHTSDRTNALVKNDKGFFIVAGEYMAPANEVAKYTLKDEAKTAVREQQLGALIDMRRLYGRLIDAERTGDAEQHRTALRGAYEAFVKAHGSLSESFGLGYLEKIDDPFYPALAALEIATPGAKGKPSYRPATILSQSTMRGARKMDAPSIADAFVLARNESVNPSVDRIAELSGESVQAVREKLIGMGAAFELPNGDFAPADIYLSGNVREKLRQAQAGLDAGNTAMKRNIEELKKVQPPDVPYYKIETQMGATWVPASIYADYIAHMLGMDSAAEIQVDFQAGSWRVNFDSALNHRPEAQSGFGSRHVWFKRLVRAAIANQTITVRRKDSNGNEYVDEDATKEVNGKISDMRLKFGEWIWKDPTRRVALEREYNEVRNAYATPRFDGSFLTFQGMALSLGRGPFELREHQVNAIWRALVTRKSLNAHEVGTGKTFTMGGIAVESRRYGIAKKPLLFAHNANSKSVAYEIQMMYPAAKVLYVDNLSAENIKTRMMQIANDDWDVVVVPHSLIDRIGFKEETLMGMAKEEIADLELAAEEAADEDGTTITADMWNDEEELKKLRSPTAKQLVKARMKIISTIKKLAMQASKDGAVSFEDMGVDMILVDEAHEFKKPPIATKMRMKGLQTQTSDRSIAMMFLTKYVRSMNNGANVHLFTGTPITNTMTEVFHMMRYMMQEEMQSSGLADWDGWFGSFAREVNDVELNPAGEYEAVTRLQSFINVPELRRMIGQYMDVVFSDDMPEMRPRSVNGKLLNDKGLTDKERAELMNGRTEPTKENPAGAQDRPYKKVINESSDMSPDQMEVFEKVQGYARSWRNMAKKDRKEAMLAGAPESPIIHEGIAARASFDVRLVDAIRNAGKEGSPEMTPHPDSKPARVVKNLLDLYRSDDRVTQVVFMEQGMSTSVTRREGPVGAKRSVSYPAFSTMKDMIERLVQAGIPRTQIAAVTGATSKDKRKEIADAMNTGKVRIVFGSSDSLGVGVNMQRNLRAMHHMDAPWMPGELEQRNGRGHRQGNQWNTVLEYRYLTDRLDGRRWQVLAIKQRFITDFMKSKGEARVIEGDAASDEQGDILSTFSEAAGDPRILMREKLKKKLEALQSRERLHGQAQADARGQIRDYSGYLADTERKLATIRSTGARAQVVALIEAQAGDGFRVTIDGKDFDSRVEAAAYLEKWSAENLRQGAESRVIGSYAGIDLRAGWKPWRSEPDLFFKVAGETIESNGLSFASIDSRLRNLRDTIEAGPAATIEQYKKTIAHAKVVAAEPFHLGEQLAAAEKQLADLQADLDMNPVAPPFWLRAGAPIDTEVYRDGRPFVVSGHRWASDGWFVLARDEKGQTVIPYLKAQDKQGLPLYEEHEFSPPTVQQGSTGAGVPVSTPKIVNKAVLAVDETGSSTNLRQTGAPEANETDVVFSRGRPIGGMPTTAVQSAVDELTQTWANAPDVEILASMNDAPGPVLNEWKRQNSQGAAGDIEGFHWRGKVYLVASALGTDSDTARVLFHEALGHYGLRGVFGKLLNPILRQVGNARPKEMAAKAEQYGLAITIEDARAAIRKEQPSLRGDAFEAAAQKRMDEDRLTAAEELLAEVAQARPELGIVKRAIAAIRTWLRDNIPGMQSLALTDDEIVRSFILPARGFVERGRAGPDAIAAALAFSRSYEAPVWYSELTRRVEKADMRAAPASAWLAWLKGLEQKGVKPDEIEWSGVREWLGLQQGKVTREAMHEYLKANGVQVQETVLGDDNSLVDGRTVAPRSVAKYGNYTLPGGTNYREVLLTLPAKDGLAWVDRGGNLRQWVSEEPSAEVRGAMEASGLTLKKLPLTDAAGVYKSPHWSQPNVLAHIRLNDRTDADGKRVLFVEELQSDWGQEGKKRGFKAGAAEAAAIKAEYDAAAQAVSDALNDGGDVQAARQRMAAATDAYNARINDATIPQAPFVGATDKWLTLALKRVIKMAVDEGYDRVAFVTGEQSANRYDLSKQVDSVRITRVGADEFDVAAAVKGGGRGISETGLSLARLEDTVGKDLAKRATTLPEGVGETYTDTDLKVGGEGMRSFYDTIVPAAVKGLLKKVGGGTMGVVAIEQGGRADAKVGAPDSAWPFVIYSNGREVNRVGTREIAEMEVADLKERGKDARYEQVLTTETQQPGFDITDTMREKLADGMPLFSRAKADGPTDQTKTEAFDAGNTDIRFSRATDMAAAARDAFADLSASSKTFNWWNGTIGTQYQKAQQDRQFKRVFDSTQEYILDVSRLANDAADRARDLLPKMENFRDVLKDLPGIDKNRTTKADVEAIGKAIFQGTLADQREYKPAELRSVFGLTDKQVDLYRQFRAAVNKSLDDLTTTIAAKMIRNAGIPPHMFRDELETGDHEALAKMVGDWVKRDPKMAGLANQVAEVSDRAKRLKAEGYAPLMRFGQYAVSIRGEAGELLEFRLFENQRLANKAAREARAAGKDAGVSVMSTQDYKLLKGINPESLELFGDLLEKAGVFDARDEVFQTYIREAIDQRSAMKRMLERHGYPGYSTDVRRVLASFLTSNARLASKNLHFTDMLEAVENIPKSRGDVRDDATNLVKYVQEPTEEAPKLRALLFAQYIGGNVASAMVNMTQSLTMTLPYLSQFGNPASAAKALASAMRQAAAGKVDGDLGEALARAEQAGVVSPQEIHHLNAEAMGTFGSNPVVQKAMFLWGSLFSLAEQFNRRAAFIAAYNMAPKGKDAYDFAVKAVEETQGIYNRGNRPNWARGAVGATLFTFKQFSVSYLEFLSRLPKREKVLALAILMLAAGAEGLPFADDLDDIIDTIAQRLGYSFNSKEQKRRFIGAVLGQGGAEFVLRGASAVPGMPIDISQRMGMANLLPGTGIFRKDVKDHMRDVVEFFGPVGGLAQNAARGELRPTAIANLGKAIDMFQTGMYRDDKGRRVVDVDAVDAAWKAIGFQPAVVAQTQMKTRMVQQDINLAKTVEAEIADSMAEARFEHDPAKLQDARDRLKDWNEKNPTDRIRIDGAQIVRRLREMRKTREERIIKSAPREMRQEVRSSLQ